jgi:hypothetical protein
LPTLHQPKVEKNKQLPGSCTDDFPYLLYLSFFAVPSRSSKPVLKAPMRALYCPGIKGGEDKGEK